MSTRSANISTVIETSTGPSVALTNTGDPVMRLQLALNVDDLDQAIEFYSKMFGT